MVTNAVPLQLVTVQIFVCKQTSLLSDKTIYNTQGEFTTFNTFHV